MKSSIKLENTENEDKEKRKQGQWIENNIIDIPSISIMILLIIYINNYLTAMV